MAGLLISLFETSGDAHKKVKESYKSNKFLKSSFEINNEQFKMVKYTRREEEHDYNCYVDKEIIVASVGTPLLGKVPLNQVVSHIASKLKQGVKIEEICREIDGTFCLVIYEKKKDKLDIITDAVGLLNTYYYQEGKVHVICTSEIAIARVIPVSPSLKSIAEFLRASYILDEDTFFEEIKVMTTAAHYTVDFKSQTVAKKIYYHFPKETDPSISFNEAAHSLTEVMQEMINMFPKSETICDFTGGNDSRSIIAYLYGDGRDKDEISTLFFGPRESSEYKIIKKSCDDLCIKFYDLAPDNIFIEKYYDYILLSHELGSGEENAAYHAPILWSNEKKRVQQFLFSMHGMGGELYRDARWDQEFGRRGAKRPANLRRLINWRVFQYEHDTTVYSKEFLKIIKEVPDYFFESYTRTVSDINPKKGRNTLHLDTIYLKQNLRRWGAATISSTNQIIRSVNPFLFRKPLEITLRINPKYRKGGKLKKYIAEKISPLIAKQKMQTGSPFIMFKVKKFYLFIPFYIFLVKKLIRKIFQTFIGKTVFSKVTVEDFDVSPRFRSALEDTRCKELLNYENMLTKTLYNRKKYCDFIKRAKEPGFEHYKIIGNMITLELTMSQACLKHPLDFDLPVNDDSTD